MLRNFLTKIQRNNNIQKSTLLEYVRRTSQNTSPVAKPESTTELQQTHIDEAVRRAPVLATVSPEMWRRAHETFLNHGLQTTNFLQIVTGNPQVLMRPPKRIIESLEMWRLCQFGERQLFLLVTKYPEMLNMTDEHHLLKHISFLKSCVLTTKNVWKVLMNCPNLMEQSEERIEAKMDYFREVMHIEVPEIVKSEALSKSLEEIKCRHVFLERMGLFKPRPLKADPNEPSKNPRLYKITDTSEKTFATKVCHVSLLEYEVFKELYTREMQRKDLDDPYDNDDLTSDDEN